MITEDYVSFETAKLLKEKGFPQDPHVCNTAYTSKGNLSNNAKSFVHNSETYAKCGVKPLHYSMAPTIQMALKWLREVHHLEIYLEHDAIQDEHNWWYDIGKFVNHCISIQFESESEYPTYEDAAESAIRYCLENLI